MLLTLWTRLSASTLYSYKSTVPVRVAMPLLSTLTFTSLNCFLSSLLWASLAPLLPSDCADAPRPSAAETRGKARTARVSAAIKVAAIERRIVLNMFTSSSFVLPELHATRAATLISDVNRQKSRSGSARRHKTVATRASPPDKQRMPRWGGELRDPAKHFN